MDSFSSLSEELFAQAEILDSNHRRSEQKCLMKRESQEASSESEYMQPTSSLQVMLEQEAKSYRAQCLQGRDIEGRSTDLDWFRTMTKWCYCVVDNCDLPLETVDVAINLLDRFLISNFGPLSSQFKILRESSSWFQTVTMTCLYIATKVTSTTSLTPSVLQRVSRDEILAEDIETMEMEILFALDFQLHPPTIGAFAQAYAQEELQLCNFEAIEGSEQEQRERTEFMQLVEDWARLAICSLHTLTIPNSSVALACVHLALDVMKEKRTLPEAIPSLRDPTVRLALKNLKTKVRKASQKKKKEFAAVQEELQSSLLDAAFEEALERETEDSSNGDNIIHADESQIPEASECPLSSPSYHSSSSPTTTLLT
mmetsp:Transcript_16867/g.41081  ORF Transcript_16867/g.41081 Transcript_16867/m.41081 type:complete len:370 (+) Transcript_16867:72-1181(+)|eukprot:CAMPEP_0113623390 /NCGR_PEP_ID=MMETSP0017_2-20120614/12028_1 /TAXON_ID=2856 /ORGANISM="Cylindrotheca closterium" /LENGTH=369 /DNA_ID=CAMNT_0000533329 /DNA_START=74 /DNA_END=1183 /DNA_ORIENTATION=+ /assembly_acc=CAM_ASM_000147